MKNKEFSSISITEFAKLNSEATILSIGDPHFGTSKEVIIESYNMLMTGTTHYSNSKGLVELRNAILESFDYKTYNSDNLLITPGSKQGIYYILKTLKKNSTLVIVEPHWHSYARLADDLDLKIITINGLNEESLSRLKDISFDAMIICNPNNPDGAILDEALMDYTVKIVDSKNAIIIADEIYSHYDYEGNFRSFSNYKNDKIYVVNGFSKRYAMTGWRLGFILNCNEEKLDALTNINSMIATCVSNISQYCGIAAIKSKSDSHLYHYYKSNRDLVLDYFPSLIHRLKGGLYAFVDLSNYGLTLDGEDFSQKLFAKFKIAVVPGSVYGNSYKNYFRISFSVDREKLRLALEKISLLIVEIVSN